MPRRTVWPLTSSTETKMSSPTTIRSPRRRVMFSIETSGPVTGSRGGLLREHLGEQRGAQVAARCLVDDLVAAAGTDEDRGLLIGREILQLRGGDDGDV